MTNVAPVRDTQRMTGGMSEEEKQKVKQRRFIIRAGMLIVGLWMSCLFLLFLSPVERGTFGDMFGAINALFSGSALLAAIYAVILQAEELRLTRQELKDTRTELAKQSQVFSDQLDLQRQEMRRERIPFFVITHISRQPLKKSIGFENRGALIADLTVTVSPSKRDRFAVQLTEHPRREDVDVWTLAITFQPLTDAITVNSNEFDDLEFEFAFMDKTGRRTVRYYHHRDSSKVLFEIQSYGDE